jgi:Ser/Thr protein kinase RdoA (MazF antagonist)
MELLLDRGDDAETSMRVALAAFESLQALDPEDRIVLPPLANALFSLGRLLANRAQRAEAGQALALWEQALSEFRRSQDILVRLQAEGYATGTTRGTLDRVQAEIDRCEERLAADALGS